MIAGVCTGLAAHLHLDVRWLRVAFIAAAVLAKGTGLLAYLAFWALLPLDPHEASTAHPRTRGLGALLVTSVLAVVGIVTLTALGFTSWLGTLLPLILGSLGIALVWSRADEVQRMQWRREAVGLARDAAGDGGRREAWPLVLGAGAVLTAIVGIALTRVDVGTMLQGLATTLLLIVGLLLVAFPWLNARWRREVERRAARARADERAEMAARIHDSVLQTLTLVQRHADDAPQVQQLARAEERELRAWLYGEPRGAVAFAPLLERAAHEAEARYGVTVDVITVGDVPVDAPVEALLAAAQEAMVNAARHSGAPSVQVYAEVEPDTVSVFVRDRGRGFRLEDAPTDRAGVRESIVGRMQRAGGSATVRSAPGAGTEVALLLPRGRTA